MKRSLGDAEHPKTLGISHVKNMFLQTSLYGGNIWGFLEIHDVARHGMTRF
jgi:hypothetical protein